MTRSQRLKIIEQLKADKKIWKRAYERLLYNLEMDIV